MEHKFNTCFRRTVFATAFIFVCWLHVTGEMYLAELSMKFCLSMYLILYAYNFSRKLFSNRRFWNRLWSFGYEMNEIAGDISIHWYIRGAVASCLASLTTAVLRFQPAIKGEASEFNDDDIPF